MRSSRSPKSTLFRIPTVGFLFIPPRLELCPFFLRAFLRSRDRGFRLRTICIKLPVAFLAGRWLPRCWHLLGVLSGRVEIFRAAF